MQVERETKLDLSRADFDRLRNHVKIRGLVQQINVYYDCASRLHGAGATFRIRFIPKMRPRMTLKVPIHTIDGLRDSLEVEADLGEMDHLPYPWVKNLKIEDHLSGPFIKQFHRLNITRLQRVGWIRTRRWIAELDGFLIELDHVSLPHGEDFYEAEIENDDIAIHQYLVSAIKDLAESASISVMSKFERFCSAFGRSELPH